jgi:hypothetical protein
MTNEPELLAELVKANKSLFEISKHLQFTHNFRLWVLIFCAAVLPPLGIIVLGKQ